MLEIDKLLQEHDGDTACGENLEYDTLLIEIREAIEGKPEQQIGEDNIIEGEEPDWKLVKKNCIELCGKTQNLEVVISLTQALMHLEGYSGLADGSALLVGAIEKFWDCIHPQVDPDDNDPIERLNMFAIFEDFKFLLLLQKVELISSKGVGSVSLYDIRHSKVKEQDAGDKAIDSKLIKAVFKSSEQNHKETIYSWLEQCATNFERVSSLLREKEHIGASNAPDFVGLLKVINESKSALGAYLNHADEESVNEGEAQVTTDTSETSNAVSKTKGINTRDDVISAIQEIEDYYRKKEPGSPIPLLLQRARNLVDKDFISLMEDLAPDSIQQVELVLGARAQEE